jgi:nicotinate-nucleotide adenylyltransferase
LNIALLGGTFDPIHIGHLMVAEVVREKLEPAEIVFVPASLPWLKSDRRISPAPDRIEMVRLAILGNPRYRLSTVETERSGPSYTVDTLRTFRTQVSDQDDLYFVVGWDNLLALGRWRAPSEIISLSKIVAVPRIGFRVPDRDSLEKIISGLSKRVVLLDKPEIDISASIIRERVAKGLPIDGMVPPIVADYILEKGLYRGLSAFTGNTGNDG